MTEQQWRQERQSPTRLYSPGRTGTSTSAALAPHWHRQHQQRQQAVDRLSPNNTAPRPPPASSLSPVGIGAKGNVMMKRKLDGLDGRAALPSMFGGSGSSTLCGGLLGGRRAFPSDLKRRVGHVQSDGVMAAGHPAPTKAKLPDMTMTVVAPSSSSSFAVLKGASLDKSSAIDKTLVTAPPPPPSSCFDRSSTTHSAVNATQTRATSELGVKKAEEESSVANDAGERQTKKRRLDFSSSAPSSPAPSSPARSVRFDAPPQSPPSDYRRQQPQQEQNKRRRYQRRNSKVSHMFFTTTSLGLDENERMEVEKDMSTSFSSSSGSAAASSTPSLCAGTGTDEGRARCPQQESCLLRSFPPSAQGAGGPLRSAFPPLPMLDPTLLCGGSNGKEGAAPAPSLDQMHSVIQRMMAAQRERRRIVLEAARANAQGQGFAMPKVTAAAGGEGEMHPSIARMGMDMEMGMGMMGTSAARGVGAMDPFGRGGKMAVGVEGMAKMAGRRESLTLVEAGLGVRAPPKGGGQA